MGLGFRETRGTLLGGPHNKDYSILGSMLEPPQIGKLPYVYMHIYTHLCVFIGFRLYVRAWGIWVHVYGVGLRYKALGNSNARLVLKRGVASSMKEWTGKKIRYDFWYDFMLRVKARKRMKKPGWVQATRLRVLGVQGLEFMGLRVQSSEVSGPFRNVP